MHPELYPLLHRYADGERRHVLASRSRAWTAPPAPASAGPAGMAAAARAAVGRAVRRVAVLLAPRPAPEDCCVAR